VGNLVLCGAFSVETCYFRSHLLETETLHQLLGRGLAQAGDTIMPNVIIERDLKVLLAEGGPLDQLIPRQSALRVVAHPGSAEFMEGGAVELEQLASPSPGAMPSTRILVAVGPEAGWAEPSELQMLGAAGFRCVTAGPRILRSDVAVCTLL
ncbi:unnamed protein product, partial [Polarella glacialis]